MPTRYRLAAPLAARLLGAALVLAALLVLLLTVLTAALGWSPAVILMGTGVAAVAAAAGWALLRRVAVVTLDETGYRIRLVRGAGVNRGAWREVEDAVTADVSGHACLVLRLRDGGASIIPVAAVDADRDAFVEDVREHLRRAEGLRPL